jgi:hypothetical protein
MVGIHIICIGPQLNMAGMPIAIIFIMASQRSRSRSMLMPSIGIILQTMPSLVISQLILHIAGIIMGIIIGIMPIMPGIPIIDGIPIMPGIPIGIGMVAIGDIPIGMGVFIGIVGIGMFIGIACIMVGSSMRDLLSARSS